MFVAVWPDRRTRNHLRALELGPTDALRMVKPEQWHVTLRFLGEVDETLVPDLADALHVAAARVGGPVQCRVSPSTSWFGRAGVLQIPVAGLDESASAVHEATGSLVPGVRGPHGEADARTERPFHGHLTLARATRRGVDGPTRQALAGIPFDATFTAASFDLVMSQPSPHGHVYTTRVTATLDQG